ncbi:MAG: homocysteine S-methyltransferase family protein [Clostridium perfringens]|uniref:homocysteine S-methyltransferase family protein n=1 Tax=Clostridium perfringens TaxID=1502 RepID=UPI0018A9CEB9|nr:homocysteine S-methyltransferase family protein [Clostridium perfringens]EHR1328314.1 homocysteine S-methyltransferase family protein [Clostridium perfringens]EHR1331447.1 homocysteine S-methyltransferase family protein [Clostridium perfringens]EHR1424924.1 homocysteine S-methyltransferase family protein [Clostridium perfringens]EIF6163819.1 homocysteine S-methyltransferase family protein [Clostridium perfringens]MDK0735065.1 homocysteine S-methyltransferase family protein [Clostridium perf
MKNLNLKNGVIIADGAMGTRIMELGVNLKETPSELLNIKKPELIEKIHREYIESGANLILSNTFMCNIINAKRNNYNLEEVVGAGIHIAKKACGDHGLVALDIGPLSYYIEENDSSFKEIVYENTERIINASKDKFDLVIFETLGSLKEGEFAVKKAKTLTDKKVICSFTLAYKKDIPNFIKNMVSTLEPLGVDALGINCTGYEEILIALDILKENTNLPIMIKANLGIPKKVGEELVYDKTLEEFKNLSKRALEKGVNIIGGCCGTTPEYIRAICNLK